MKEDTILVKTEDTITTRGRPPKELKVELLTENVNLFINQIESVLEKTPEQVGKFKLKEFVVAAEISAKGSLVLIGTGVETSAKGGITFKFERG